MACLIIHMQDYQNWKKMRMLSVILFKVCFRNFVLRVVSPLREKFIFFNSLGAPKFPGCFKPSVYINVVLLINFPEQFELCFYFKIQEVIKFYNQLGNKNFETDFSTHFRKIQDGVGVWLPPPPPPPRSFENS